MNTRSRQRKHNKTGSDPDTLNGSLSPPDSPTSSVAASANGRKTSRQANGTRSAAKAGSGSAPSSPTRRRAIYRVPINTWNLIVRKWEIPRKTLHVSIGKIPYSVHLSSEDGG